MSTQADKKVSFAWKDCTVYKIHGIAQHKTNEKKLYMYILELFRAFIFDGEIKSHGS